MDSRSLSVSGCDQKATQGLLNSPVIGSPLGSSKVFAKKHNKERSIRVKDSKQSHKTQIKNNRMINRDRMLDSNPICLQCLETLIKIQSSGVPVDVEDTHVTPDASVKTPPVSKVPSADFDEGSSTNPLISEAGPGLDIDFGDTPHSPKWGVLSRELVTDPLVSRKLISHFATPAQRWHDHQLTDSDLVGHMFSIWAHLGSLLPEAGSRFNSAFAHRDTTRKKMSIVNNKCKEQQARLSELEQQLPI
ncbi:hypothetical protein L1987_49269 [Smallanthus sonchifolius]|uniref:Uncharacterized protein n=1 Tax=Smallanthus sonchifolius TaxID=185202 RepID=A0ACB9FU86_9ASTR|nr:hypothetical protein L1987_49269 [Smallanthus sonchifolius]